MFFKSSCHHQNAWSSSLFNCACPEKWSWHILADRSWTSQSWIAQASAGPPEYGKFMNIPNSWFTQWQFQDPKNLPWTIALTWALYMVGTSILGSWNSPVYPLKCWVQMDFPEIGTPLVLIHFSFGFSPTKTIQWAWGSLNFGNPKIIPSPVHTKHPLNETMFFLSGISTFHWEFPHHKTILTHIIIPY